MQGLVNGNFHLLRTSSSLVWQQFGYPTLRLAFLAVVYWDPQVSWKPSSPPLVCSRISSMAHLPQPGILICSSLEMSLCPSDLAEILIKVLRIAVCHELLFSIWSYTSWTAVNHFSDNCTSVLYTLNMTLIDPIGKISNDNCKQGARIFYNWEAYSPHYHCSIY